MTGDNLPQTHRHGSEPEAEWIRREDVAWTTGRQLSLTEDVRVPPNPQPPQALVEEGE